MKILPVEKVREADAYTIKHEPVDSTELMERAARECYKWIYKKLKRGQRVKIFCGPGNNGGDGLVCGRLLARQNAPVEIYVVRFTKKVSPDFQTNYDRLELVSDIRVYDIRSAEEMPDLESSDIIVDAIFGSGLSRPAEGLAASAIRHINRSPGIVVAIDIPSGLFSDACSMQQSDAIVKADYTLSFQFPKYAFLFPENEVFVGDWTVLPIGLHPEYIEQVEVKNHYVEDVDIKKAVKKRPRFSHKGTYGHALLISGSYGKMGAAVLAARACLRSGAGLVTAHIPSCGYNIMQTAFPEAMVSLDKNESMISAHPVLDNYTAIGVGPGIGTEKETQNALKMLIQNSSIPLVLDADALNILGENKTWISFLPPLSILTPHPKEFERIAGKSGNCFDRIDLQREFAIKHNIYVVVKGAHTSTCCPDGTCYFNSTGNPGMATGGSGDVLTGIILGFLAQGYSPKESAIMGVYMHGLAGDYAASRLTEEAMLAGEITEFLTRAFREIR